MADTADYTALVRNRKSCHECLGLTNPADVGGGSFDSDQIGPWSLWQGNLNAALMVVGQDWGDTDSFRRQAGREGLSSPTNRALVELVGIAGVSIGDPGSPVGRDVTFFTNAILCLKGPEGGLQGKVMRPWFKNCARFLRRQIEIIGPKVVVGLGEHAYRTILGGFNLTGGRFLSAVEANGGTLLPNGTRAFAVYHCGVRIQNTHRKMDIQRQDWARIRPFLPVGRPVSPFACAPPALRDGASR